MNRKRAAQITAGAGTAAAILYALLRVVLSDVAGLPIISQSTPVQRRCVEVWRGSGVGRAAQIADLGVWCVRYHPEAYELFLAGQSWEWFDSVIGADIQAIRDAGAVPILVLHPTHPDDICKPMPASEIAVFARFARDIVTRYVITHLDLGNEVDAVGGLPGLFGCHGDAGLFADTWNAVRESVPSNVQMGVSFMLDSTRKHPAILGILEQMNYRADWIGAHHYAYYGGERTLAGGSAYPGGLPAKLAWMQAQTSAPVWLTETNLIWPGGDCGGDFPQAQADYLMDVLLEIETVIVVYALTSYPGWACAGMPMGSPAYQVWQIEMGGYP